MVKELMPLVGKVNDDVIKRLDLFFINTNLDTNQRKFLVDIFSEISMASLANQISVLSENLSKISKIVK